MSRTMSLDLRHKSVGGAKNRHYQGSISGGNGHHVSSRLIFLIVCLTSYFVFSIAVLPHSPGVMYYHLFRPEELVGEGVFSPYLTKRGVNRKHSLFWA